MSVNDNQGQQGPLNGNIDVNALRNVNRPANVQANGRNLAPSNPPPAANVNNAENQPPRHDQYGNLGQANREEATGMNIGAIAKVPFPQMHDTTNVDLWFARMRSWFELHRVTADNSKFNMVVANLRSDMANHVEDLICNPPVQDRFETIRRALVSQFADSERTRIHKLLSGITLGDKKPSYLLQELRKANVGGDDTLLKNVWMQRMPIQAQAALSIAQGTLNEVAALADVAINNRGYEVNQIGTSSAKSESEKQMSDFIREFARVTELRKGRNERGRSKSRGQASDRRSRDSSRARSAQREFDLCWYHYKFGANANKCGRDANPPKQCKYVAKND